MSLVSAQRPVRGREAVGSNNTGRSLDEEGDRGLMTRGPALWIWSRQ